MGKPTQIQTPIITFPVLDPLLVTKPENEYFGIQGAYIMLLTQTYFQSPTSPIAVKLGLTSYSTAS